MPLAVELVVGPLADVDVAILVKIDALAGPFVSSELPFVATAIDKLFDLAVAPEIALFVVNVESFEIFDESPAILYVR